MRRVGVNTNVSATRGLAELNQHKRVDVKERRNGGLSEEEESRNNEDVNSIRPKELGQGHAALHRQHQLPQGPVVQWESFLPLRSLNVLLVENDDSTRHVVTALLRNCGYEVTAVANGLEAWKLLIDLNKQIDLVLTEVVMPYLSGIGLLSKIMSHVTRKNTPVIMMSSDDSMGIVFNCLSKGAVDFLVKPIRKNELKTLWQHVWRKCHSSSGSGSGSGSESGIRDNKSTKSRSIEESDDISDTSNEDDGANSLWDKEQAHDINSAQVARPETSKLDNNEMGKDLMIGVTKSSSLKTEDKNKKKTDKFCESNMKNVGDKLDISMNIGCENGASRTESVKAHKEAVKASHLLKNMNTEDNYSKESPALELSLKRPRDVEDADVTAQERNVLHHSGLSAFSRYNNVSNDDQTPTGNVDSCSPPGTGSEAAKQNNILSNSNGTNNHRSNGSDDMGSTTNNAFTTKPDDNNPPPNNSTIVVHEHHTSTLQPLIPCASKGDAANTTQQQVEVRHHHHHYHHHHHHVHKRQQQTMMNPDDGSLRNMVSNIFTASAEGDAANYGSASGSNNKSNGEAGGSSEKGTGSAPLLEDGKTENNNGGPKTVKGGDGSGSGSGVDQDRVAQREAALVKFRQKRKERCFEKKVRYQSRKKLAEQRPRVRGQFVRHGAKGVNNEDTDL